MQKYNECEESQAFLQCFLKSTHKGVWKDLSASMNFTLRWAHRWLEAGFSSQQNHLSAFPSCLKAAWSTAALRAKPSNSHGLLPIRSPSARWLSNSYLILWSPTKFNEQLKVRYGAESPSLAESTWGRSTWRGFRMSPKLAQSGSRIKTPVLLYRQLSSFKADQLCPATSPHYAASPWCDQCQLCRKPQGVNILPSAPNPFRKKTHHLHWFGEFAWRGGVVQQIIGRQQISSARGNPASLYTTSFLVTKPWVSGQRESINNINRAGKQQLYLRRSHKLQTAEINLNSY